MECVPCRDISYAIEIFSWSCVRVFCRARGQDVCTFTSCCFWKVGIGEMNFFSKGNARDGEELVERERSLSSKLSDTKIKADRHHEKKNFEAAPGKNNENLKLVPSAALLSLARKARTLQRARTNNLSFQIGITELRFLWKRPGGGYTNTLGGYTNTPLKNFSYCDVRKTKRVSSNF